MNLNGRSFLKECDFTRSEFLYLINLAADLRAEKQLRQEAQYLGGRNIALVFEKTSTRTRSAFEVAAHDQGAHVSYLGPGETQLGEKESVHDTARVLGRMYDGIEFRGFAHADVEELARYAGIPVWNGLTDQWHPTQALCDMLTMQDNSAKPLEEITFMYVGDARNNMANSLLVTGALLGMDVRICGPRQLWPDEEVHALARVLANESGGRIAVTDDLTSATAGADYVYTDVWLSMGEPAAKWAGRIDLLRAYQVTMDVLQMTRNPEVRFLHCLPAMHNVETEIGEMVYEKFGLEALEVTDEVFESAASLVFEQAENRMHTIKAVMVATIGDRTSGGDREDRGRARWQCTPPARRSAGIRRAGEPRPRCRSSVGSPRRRARACGRTRQWAAGRRLGAGERGRSRADPSVPPRRARGRDTGSDRKLAYGSDRAIVHGSCRVRADTDGRRPRGPWLRRADEVRWTDIYAREQAAHLANALGWQVRRDGSSWRRVVASPEPIRILEVPEIELLLCNGNVVVCAGGGGVPVVRDATGSWRDVEAVVDKDLAAAVLARQLRADALLLLTDVSNVEIGWGTSNACPIETSTVDDLRGLRLPPGSMGPKVEAACRFVESGGRIAAIGRLEDAEALLAGTAGTTVVASHTDSPMPAGRPAKAGAVSA